MVNPRQRRKVKQAGKKVSRRPKRVNLRKLNITEDAIKEAWDNKKTVSENFKQIGLACHLNQDIGSSNTRKNILNWQGKRAEILEKIQESKHNKQIDDNSLDMTPMNEGEDEIFAEMGKIFAEAEKKEPEDKSQNDNVKRVVTALEDKAKVPNGSQKRPLSENELGYITALIDKYGNDTMRMFYDIELNFMQKTAKQLSRMIARL